MDGRPPDAV